MFGCIWEGPPDDMAVFRLRGLADGFSQLLKGGMDGYHIVDYVSRLMLFPKRA